jgi:hypothetical protein
MSLGFTITRDQTPATGQAARGINRMKPIPLSTFVDELRRQIDQAQLAAVQTDYKSALKMDKVTLTIQVVADQEKSAQGGVNIFAVTLGTELKEMGSRMHSVTFEFTPVQKPGGSGPRPGSPHRASAGVKSASERNEAGVIAPVTLEEFPAIVLGFREIEMETRVIVLQRFYDLAGNEARNDFACQVIALYLSQVPQNSTWEKLGLEPPPRTMRLDKEMLELVQTFRSNERQTQSESQSGETMVS